MRHGDAQSYASSDAARELTTLGVEQVQRNAIWLSQHVSQLDQILVSPFVRAQQTQQIVSTIIDSINPVETINDLVPEGDARQVHDYVDAIVGSSEAKSILLVSHMPLVSYLVESFTIARNCPIFPTAGIAFIEYDPEKMKGQFKMLNAP
jgi:phosphohistidine phosphatase